VLKEKKKKRTKGGSLPPGKRKDGTSLPLEGGKKKRGKNEQVFFTRESNKKVTEGEGEKGKEPYLPLWKGKRKKKKEGLVSTQKVRMSLQNQHCRMRFAVTNDLQQRRKKGDVARFPSTKGKQKKRDGSLKKREEKKTWDSTWYY